MTIPSVDDIREAKGRVAALGQDIDAKDWPAARARVAAIGDLIEDWESDQAPPPGPIEPPWPFTRKNFIDPPDRPAVTAPTSLPKAGDFKVVRSDSDLQEVLALTRGENEPLAIVLEDGEYDYPLQCDGCRMFVIAKSENAVLKAPAVFSGDLVYAKGPTYASSLTISGKSISVLGSAFTGAKGVIVNSSARHWRIGYNRFTGNPSGSRSDHILVKCPSIGGGLPDHGRIYCNFFRDTAPKAQTEDHHIYVAESWVDYRESPGFENLVIAYNVFRTSRRRSLYVKRRCDIFCNDIVMAEGRGAAFVRHGEKCRVWANRIVGGRDMLCVGRDHDFRGNSWTEPLLVMSQHLSGTSNRYHAADRALIAGCEGPITLGYRVSGGKHQANVRGVRILGHAGKITRKDEQDTVIEAAVAMACPAPAKLSEQDVGPEAMPA